MRVNRTESAKTSLRPQEKELLVEISAELGITPSEVVYIAVLRFLREERPEADIRVPTLVS